MFRINYTAETPEATSEIEQQISDDAEQWAKADDHVYRGHAFDPVNGGYRLSLTITNVKRGEIDPALDALDDYIDKLNAEFDVAFPSADAASIKSQPE